MVGSPLSRNVDLSRAFDGTGARIQRLLKKAQSGKPIITAALGGSSEYHIDSYLAGELVSVRTDLDVGAGRELTRSPPVVRSVSIGAGCDCAPWHELVHDWLNETFVDTPFTHSDGAVGARGSDYFK